MSSFLMLDIIKTLCYERKCRAYFHHFGTMTHTPGIGNLSAETPKIGNFLASLIILSNHKKMSTSYLSEFGCTDNL